MIWPSFYYVTTFQDCEYIIIYNIYIHCTLQVMRKHEYNISKLKKKKNLIWHISCFQDGEELFRGLGKFMLIDCCLRSSELYFIVYGQVSCISLFKVKWVVFDCCLWSSELYFIVYGQVSSISLLFKVKWAVFHCCLWTSE